MKRILTFAVGILLSASMSAGQTTPAEGVKVHGHWVIELYNPDGSRASRYEFDNAFVGQEFVAKLLARAHSVGTWTIETQSPGNDNPCVDENGADVPCVLSEPDVMTQVTEANEFVLSVVFSAEKNGRLWDFNVWVKPCPPETPPTDPCGPDEIDPSAACLGIIPSPCGDRFSGQRSPDAPIPVVENQLIVITVTYSFTS